MIPWVEQCQPRLATPISIGASAPLSGKAFQTMSCPSDGKFPLDETNLSSNKQHGIRPWPPQAPPRRRCAVGRKRNTVASRQSSSKFHKFAMVLNSQSEAGVNSDMANDEASWAAHNTRFRRVANRYPMRVNEAYGGDLAAAAKDDDAAVAAWVRVYEISIGLEPRDWVAIGKGERRAEPDAR